VKWGISQLSQRTDGAPSVAAAARPWRHAGAYRWVSAPPLSSTAAAGSVLAAAAGMEVQRARLWVALERGELGRGTGTRYCQE